MSVETFSHVKEEIAFPLPAPLKSHLEDDCFWILRRNRLLRLPRKPNVETILREYYSHCLATATEETNFALLAEVLDGLKIYFDFMIADHLLYIPENVQYKNIMEEAQRMPRTFQTQGLHSVSVAGSSVEGSENLDTSSAANPGTANSCTDPKMEVDVAEPPPSSSCPLMPSNVYGAEHLLRLFVRMPLFLSRAQIPNTHIPILHQYWKDLLGHICSRRQELFSEDHYEDTYVPLVPPPSSQTASTPTSTLDYS